MSTAGTFAALVSVLGILLVLLSAVIQRRWQTPGTTALAAFVAIVGLGGSMVFFVADSESVSLTTQWLATCLEVATVPWLVFALQYTGRDYLVSSRTQWLLAGVYLGFIVVPVGLGIAGVSSEILGLLAIPGYMLGLVLTLLGVTLVLETTYRHGYVSVWVGLLLAVVAVDPWFVTMVGFATAGQFSPAALYALYAAGLLLTGAVLVGLLFGLTAAEVTPGTQTLGRRAIVAETSDLVVVVDDDDRIVELNAAARETLGVTSDEICGQRLTKLLDSGTGDLRETSNVELPTEAGVRQFDVEVIRLTNRATTSLGWLVSLRDVTDRRRREQGLEVLNRLLRHNLRNRLDVTKARTSAVRRALDDPELTDHLSAAEESVDSVLGLAEKARATQQALTHNRSERTTVAVRDTVEQIGERVAEESSGEVTVEGENVEVRVDESLFSLAVRNVVENALVHSTAETPRATVGISETADGVRVRVDDNGPGIPDEEIAAIRAGEETATEHASGIGLWLVEWAITACGGTVEFGDGPDGGRVDVWLPYSDRP